MVTRCRFVLEAKDRVIELGQVTRIMGVINVTPDSFSQDGIWSPPADVTAHAVKLARRMIRDGADIIDVGGESTRPGAHYVGIEEEIRRVVPVVAALASKTAALISVDTYKPAVAKAALEAGAHLVNIVKGTPVDDRMLRLCKEYQAGLVLMHMRGTPRTMQQNINYEDVLADVIGELKKSVEKCRRFGLNDRAIVVDPGIGFAKTVEHNLVILHSLARFASLRCPVMVGVSRKSFIGKILQLEAKDRLSGTLAAVVCSVMGGAHLVRVHDVKAVRQAVSITDAIMNSK